MPKLNGSYPILNPRLTRQRQDVCALSVVTKAPRSGSSKTRLTPPLTADEAATLSACFLRDTCSSIDEITVAGASAGVAVYTPVGAELAFEGLLPTSFSLLAQRGESFGERLLFAAQDLFAVGYESLCLINSDSPTLPQAYLRAAVSELARDGDRVVLGAADDGGYYLIGLKKFHPDLFKNIDWSTSRVLEQTIERAVQVGLEVSLLPCWYDVDDALTLRRLCDEFFHANEDRPEVIPYDARHTRQYLSSLLDRVPNRIGERCFAEK